MSNIDEKIRQALTEEDKRAIEATGNDAGLFDLMAMSFSGKQAWLTYYMYIMGFAVFFAGLYFLRQFFIAPEIKTSLGWMLAIIACLMVMVIIKVIAWLQMIKQELMRDIKRLEMRVMLLAEQDQH